jgi:hypothetical protein
MFYLDLVRANVDVNARILDLGNNLRRVFFSKQMFFFLVQNHLVHVLFENIVVIGNSNISIKSIFYFVLFSPRRSPPRSNYKSRDNGSGYYSR